MSDSPSLKRSFEEMECLNQFGEKTFLAVVLRCKDLWHYMVQWVPDKGKYYIAKTCKAWYEAVKGAKLSERYTRTNSFESLLVYNHFTLQLAEIKNYMDLMFCPSSVADIELGMYSVTLRPALFHRHPHITRLSIRGITEHIVSLPTTLKTLELADNSIQHLYPGLLPGSLTHLCMNKYYGGALPSNLIHLKMIYRIPMEKNVLPPTLETLHIQVSMWDWCKAGTLPNGLKALTVYCVSNEGCMDEYFYPKSLQTLTLRATDIPGGAFGLKGCVITINRFRTHLISEGIERVYKGYLNARYFLENEKDKISKDLVEVHDLSDHPHWSEIGCIPQSVKVVFFGGVPYDPVCKKPVPWTDLGITGKTDIYEPLGF